MFKQMLIEKEKEKGTTRPWKKRKRKRERKCINMLTVNLSLFWMISFSSLIKFFHIKKINKQCFLLMFSIVGKTGILININ